MATIESDAAIGYSTLGTSSRYVLVSVTRPFVSTRANLEVLTILNVVLRIGLMGIRPVSFRMVEVCDCNVFRTAAMGT